MKLMLIDGENCYSTRLLSHIAYKKDWEVVLIVRKDHILKLLPASGIRVENGLDIGRNAEDFHLISMLGIKMAKGNYSEAVIVSNDKGFDAAVKYFNTEGYKVRRVTSDYVIARFKGTDKEIVAEKHEEKHTDTNKNSGKSKGKRLSKSEVDRLSRDLFNLSERITPYSSVKHIKKYNIASRDQKKDAVEAARIISEYQPGIRTTSIVQKLETSSIDINVSNALKTLVNDKIITVYMIANRYNYHIGWNKELLRIYLALNGG